MSSRATLKRQSTRLARRRSRAELASEMAARAVLLCPCGLPLHYRSERVRVIVEHVCRAMGLNVRVSINRRAYVVPRHFLALHGAEFRQNASTLALHYGFPESDLNGTEMPL